MVTVSVQTDTSKSDQQVEQSPTFWDEEVDNFLDGVESFDEGSPFEYEVRLACGRDYNPI